MIQGTKKWIITQLEQTLDDDGYYVVDVVGAGRPHTRGQQDRFYKVCRNLSTGNTQKFAGWSPKEIKNWLIEEWFGEMRGITGLTTKEMADLIDFAQQVSAEEGIYDEI